MHRLFKNHCLPFSILVVAVLAITISIYGIADDSCLYTDSQGLQTVFSLVPPVIPSSGTISGNSIYLSFFKIHEKNFWEGNIVRLGLSEQGEIVDKYGNPALKADGSLNSSAVPFWETQDWADPTNPSHISNSSRNIYTFLGSSKDLQEPSNSFSESNPLLTYSVLAIDPSNPSDPSRGELINFVRGADVYDEDNDGDTTENRASICGDILHSEPLVFPYKSSDGSVTVVIFYGSNDGMLHAVLDSTIDSDGNETIYGTELWAFIPPDLLHKLRYLLGTGDHPLFVDSSPKVFFKDSNEDGILDPTDNDQLVLICGERKGGSSYFALDVTDPEKPRILWRIAPVDDSIPLNLPSGANPDVIISQLGQSWSVPQIAFVKTSPNDTIGTPVWFIGAGYSEDNSRGNAIFALDIFDGSIVKAFKNGTSGISSMGYSIPSTVLLIDEDQNGFVDKLYVGDLGGQVWRIGKFTDAKGDPLPFPHADEVIGNWTGHIIFKANDPGDPGFTRKFFFPPSVALEKTYDLLFIGSGDMEDPCIGISLDRIYAFQDIHDSLSLTELDLVDVTAPPPVPDLDAGGADADHNGHVDRGWFIRLPSGEKVLSRPLVFNKILYVTTFSPGPDGGVARLWAVDYKTGAPPFYDEGKNDTWNWNMTVGKGISPRPVILIKEKGAKLLVSINITAGPADHLGPGILEIEAPSLLGLFHYLWWKIL